MLAKALRALPSRLAPTMSSCAPHLRQPLPPGTDTLEVLRAFRNSVNMSAAELEAFLESPHSRKAAEHGEHPEEHEGRKFARRIIELLQKLGERREDPQDPYNQSLLYEGDLEQMHQITQYIRCRREELRQAGLPPGELDHTGQRYEFMLFGFDPLKEAMELHAPPPAD